MDVPDPQNYKPHGKNSLAWCWLGRVCCLILAEGKGGSWQRRQASERSRCWGCRTASVVKAYEMSS